MRQKTLLASLVTLTFMCGFVFATLAGVFIASQQVSLVLGLLLGVAATVLWSLIMWLVSPWIMDLMQSWIYSARGYSIEALRQERPKVAEFIVSVCQRHRIKVPRLKLIDDGTPQAYCYGSTANSARLVTTRGLVDTLDDEELKAVYGHELGHIVHRDFIVMTIAATLLSVLWTIYVVARNIRGKNNSRPAYPIALAALIFYWISQYLLLYLSRTREYYADAFSGEETGNPNALSLALIKIAYGLTLIEQTPLRQKLMGGTRALGIADARASSGVGLAYRSVAAGEAEPTPHVAPGQPAYAGAYGAANAAANPYAVRHAPATSVTLEGVRRIEKVMLFDLYNPWAKVAELSATHPLTGKRIHAMGTQAMSLGQRPLLSFEQTDAQGQALDKRRLYGTFMFELTIYFLPHILGVAFAAPAIASFAFSNNVLGGLFAGLIVAGIGLGMTIKGFYKFPSLRNPAQTTVLDLMSDPYASPLKGRPVVLDGTVTGRADAGNKIGEDFTLLDVSGGLMMINYESPFGKLGNYWFALRRVGKLMNQRVRVLGWFRRSISQQVDLKNLHTAEGQQVASYTAFWGKAGGIFVLLLGVLLAVIGAAAAS
jgi:Zn-dependent protease with chaperone function